MFPLASFPLPRAAGPLHALNSSAVTGKLKLALVRLVCGCLTSEQTFKSCIGRDVADLSQSTQPQVILMVTFQMQTEIELSNEKEHIYHITSYKTLILVFSKQE